MGALPPEPGAVENVGLLHRGQPPSALARRLEADPQNPVDLPLRIDHQVGRYPLAILLPGYVLALGLSFVVPPIFTAIAFDSGGVASGPMTATFLLPFAQGACEALGGNVVTDAFGVVAMVAMTPLLTIQMLGLLYQLKMKRAAQETPPAPVDEEIIEL